MKTGLSKFVEYSTGQIEISACLDIFFKFFRMSRYVLHLQMYKNIVISLKSRFISNFKKSTFQKIGGNNSRASKPPVLDGDVVQKIVREKIWRILDGILFWDFFDPTVRP